MLRFTPTGKGPDTRAGHVRLNECVDLTAVWICLYNAGSQSAFFGFAQTLRVWCKTLRVSQNGAEHEQASQTSAWKDQS